LTICSYYFYSLAENNDFQPYNRAVKYTEEGLKTVEPAGDHISPEVAKFLMDMDPNEPARPLRDGKWVKKNIQSTSVGDFFNLPQLVQIWISGRRCYNG
jgi:hypothetical protein